MKDLRMAHAHFMSDLQSCAFDSMELASSLEIQLASSKSSVSKLQETAALLDKEAESQQEQITQLRAQLHDTTLELSNLRTSGGFAASTPKYAGSQLAMDTSMNRDVRGTPQLTSSYSHR